MGGWRQWDEVERHLVGRRFYLETSFTIPYLGEQRFCELVEAHGAQKVLFGSDGPWADAALEVERLSRLPLPDHAREAILWRNAARLLNARSQRDEGSGSSGALNQRSGRSRGCHRLRRRAALTEVRPVRALFRGGQARAVAVGSIACTGTARQRLTGV